MIRNFIKEFKKRRFQKRAYAIHKLNSARLLMNHINEVTHSGHYTFVANRERVLNNPKPKVAKPVWYAKYYDQ